MPARFSDPACASALALAGLALLVRDRARLRAPTRRC